MNKALLSSKNMEFETPGDFYEYWNKRFHFTIDLAATEQNKKVERCYTKKEDALKQDWSKEVGWLNPPYGRSLIHWMKKIVTEVERGATVVCLVPPRMDTRWFHRYGWYADEIHVVENRLAFELDGVPSESGAPFPSMVLVFMPGKRREAHAPVLYRFTENLGRPKRKTA